VFDAFDQTIQPDAADRRVRVGACEVTTQSREAGFNLTRPGSDSRSGCGE